jgi:hypothetical protein
MKRRRWEEYESIYKGDEVGDVEKGRVFEYFD